MKTINNSSSLLALLSNLNGASFVNLTTITEPKMKKTGNPFADCKVQKMTTQVMQFGYSYENAVNNRTDKDIEFVAEPLKWGEWLIPNKVITHKGNLYARFYKVGNEKAKTIFLIDGFIASAEQTEIIKSFLPAPSESNRQAEVSLTDNQVKPRDFAFKSIVGLKVNGETYKVVEQVEVATIGA